MFAKIIAHLENFISLITPTNYSTKKLERSLGSLKNYGAIDVKTMQLVVLQYKIVFLRNLLSTEQNIQKQLHEANKLYLDTKLSLQNTEKLWESTKKIEIYEITIKGLERQSADLQKELKAYFLRHL